MNALRANGLRDEADRGARDARHGRLPESGVVRVRLGRLPGRMSADGLYDAWAEEDGPDPFGEEAGFRPAELPPVAPGDESTPLVGAPRRTGPPPARVPGLTIGMGRTRGAAPHRPERKTARRTP